MRKPYTHSELSERTCSHPGCSRRIKLNVLARRPSATKCYRHWLGDLKGAGKRNGGKIRKPAMAGFTKPELLLFIASFFIFVLSNTLPMVQDLQALGMNDSTVVNVGVIYESGLPTFTPPVQAQQDSSSWISNR